MSEWADYIITAVQYDGTEIDSVKRRRETPEGGLSPPIEIPRQAVAQDLEFDVSYCTAIRDENDNWQRGDDIEAFELDGELYIRTEEGENPADNLGGLSEY